MNLSSKILVANTLIMVMMMPAVGAGKGTVNFSGTVIDAPCGISPDTADQSIYFGPISLANLKAQNGSSVPQPLVIQLTNCVLGNSKGVTVSFSAPSTQPSGPVTELATTGTTGTVVIISSPGGSPVSFDNTPGVLFPLATGNNKLLYSTYVKAGSQMTVNPGDFTATANFTLNYQ